MLRRVLLSTDSAPALDAPAWRRVCEAFPGISFELDGPGSAPALTLATWRNPELDLLALDAQLLPALERTGTLALGAPAGAAPRFALEVLTHLQAWTPLGEDPSRGPAFAQAAQRHRALQDLTKPLVRADYLHALDVLHWVLRLDRRASAALQLAALFHDIERLHSEPDARVEHRAPDYQAFKDAHARGGAEIVREVLSGSGLEPAVVARTAELVAHHERPGSDPELALLNDADALSFFSLNAAGYLNYFGPSQTKKKVAYTLARLRPTQRWRLTELRLPAPVRAWLSAELGTGRGATT